MGIGAAVSGATILVSMLGAYYSSQIATEKDFGDIRTAQAETVIKIQNQEKSTDRLEKRLDTFDRKIDALLLKSGINPSSIKE
jgi:hypothetical protein